MKYATTAVTEALIEDIVGLFVTENASVSIDREEILSAIAGKNGVMFEATQEEENREVFFRLLSNELSKKSEVQECRSMLLCFVVPDGDNLGMDEMGFFIDLVGQMLPEADVIWGTNMVSMADRMKVILVVA
ncbi:MAG: hypothetical protein MJZ67_03880 [Bacteroidales bacterium]|nr:hypothetical protein [Bacteroidales bacterium]